MVTLGFIGLGRMGGPMATHLVHDGYDVVVFDRRREAIEAVEAAGARGVDSTAAVGEVADVVFLSLPGPTAVNAVVSELEAAVDPGAVVVDTTTSTPETTRTVADRLANAEVTVLGAPVSGETSGAEAGTLTVMGSGERAAFEATREYVESFASDVFHVGSAPGHGHAVKLLNDFLSNTAMVTTSEAVVLGQEAGLDIGTMCEIFNVSTGRNSATEGKFPDAVAAGSDVGFALELMERDSRLLLAFAETSGVSLLLGSIVRNQVGRTRNRYGGDGDMTDVYDYVRDTTAAGDGDDT